MLHTRPRLVPGDPASLKARVLAAQLPADARTRHWGPETSRVPKYADFAIRWMAASRGSLSGPEIWLVRHRQPGADPVRVFLCHAPRHIQPARLEHLTSACWAIETCFRKGKQLLDPDDYESRSRQGWHRHMTLCLLL